MLIRAGVVAGALLASASRAAADDEQAPYSVPGEVIIVEDAVPPAVKPVPQNYSPIKAPPYSARAIVSDAWTRAWMLVEIAETGEVRRFKWLKRPGYDLEPIAEAELFKLRFSPARDAQGRAIATTIVWSIEWPSAWWLDKFVGTRTRMPPLVGFPPRSKAAYVPCRGSGPMDLGSLHPTYRDCSQPDLTKAKARGEPWIDRPTSRRGKPSPTAP